MSRDDIVFNPSIGPQNQASTPVAAREARTLERHRRKRGALRRLAQARARKRAATRARRARSGRKRVRRASALKRGATRNLAMRAGTFVGQRAATAAVANPVGLAIGAVVAGLVVAGAVTLRLASGRSFENMGEQINKMLLGDLDDTARAKMGTRKYLQGDSDLTRINAASDGNNAQIEALSKDLFDLRLRNERGASLFREDERFQSNGVFDILILRAQQVFLDFWNGNGGPDAVDRLQDNLQEITQRRSRKDPPR